MKRFVVGEDLQQGYLLPDSLDDYVSEDNPVRVVEVLIDEPDPPRTFGRSMRDSEGA